MHYFYSSLARVFLLTVGLFLVFKLIYKQVRTAAVTTAIFLFLFNSYSLVWGWIEEVLSAQSFFNQNYDLAIFWGGILYLALVVLVVYGFGRLANHSARWKKMITVFTFILTISLLSSAGIVYIAKYSYLAHHWELKSSWLEKQSPMVLDSNNQTATHPDIYLIVLDAYSADNVLNSLYGYDNSGFTSELEKLGFLVVNNAKTNYNQTRTEFCSMLKYAISG